MRVFFQCGLSAITILFACRNDPWAQTSTIANGADVTVAPSTSVVTTGNIHIAAGGSLNNQGSLQLQGNWTNDGSYTDNSGVVTFTASSAGKTISGSLTGANKFNNLVFNGVGGSWLFVNDAEVQTNLSLANGDVTAPAGTLTINGSFIQTVGAFHHNNGLVLLKGSSAQSYTAATPLTFYNLTNNNSLGLPGVSINSDLILENELRLMPLSKLTLVSGDIILRSSETNTADIAPVPSEPNVISYGSGRFIVERYIATGTGAAPNHGKSWQLLAVPTTGQTIKEAWQEGAATINGDPKPGYGTMLTSDVPNAVSQPDPGFDVFTALGPSLKTYNNVTNKYDGAVSTQLSIYNQKGYFVFVRGDRSVTTLNQPPNATILRTKGILFTPENPPPVTAVPDGKFESAGNPYASALDMRNIIRTGGVTEFFQVWDPRLGGTFNLGAFQTFSKNISTGDYEVTPGGGSYGAPGSVHNFIQSGQAFFVQATGSNGTLGFDESVKAGGSTLFSRPERVSTPSQKYLRVALREENISGDEGIIDGVLSSYADSYSNRVDGLDARKSFNTGENLSIKSGNKFLVIERRQPVIERDTIFLSQSGLRSKSYQFEITAGNLNGVQGFLEDSYLHKRTPLNLQGNTQAAFDVTNSAGSFSPGRFRIVFAPVEVLPVSFHSLKAYRANKDIIVEWKVENELNIKEYEIEKSLSGVQFTTLEIIPATTNGNASTLYTARDANPSSGYNYYRVKSVGVNGTTAYSNIVKVLVEDAESNITLLPNPIKGGIIQLHFLNEPAGDYGIRLFNKAGQKILSKQLKHDQGNPIEFIKWPSNLAHGLYQLELIKPGHNIQNLNVMY